MRDLRRDGQSWSRNLPSYRCRHGLPHCLSTLFVGAVVDTGDQYAVASDSSRAVTSMSPLATSSSRSASSRSPSYAYPCAAWAAVSTRGHVTARRPAAMAGSEQIADHRPDINELANPLSAKWSLGASIPLQSHESRRRCLARFQRPLPSLVQVSEAAQVGRCR